MEEQEKLPRTQEDIHEKGFRMDEYARMRIGGRKLDDLLIDIDSLQKKVSTNYASKDYVLQAISSQDYESMRAISNYFYENSGIYYRLCRYMAYIYRFDWYVTPYIDDIDKEKEGKILKDFSKVLLYLDRSDLKKIFRNISLAIMKDGAYYGILVDFGDKFGFQPLPADYCRQRFFAGPNPIIELNLRFFDAYFPRESYRRKVLKLFPKDLQKAYELFKRGKLPGDYPGEYTSWYPLDPGTSVKVSLSESGDFPPLVGVIPSIIDLDNAQALDREKTMQQLVKIIVQKLPLDKNGDLIFDVDEAKDIHNNAVQMLRRAVGIDVLTTFAEVEKIDTRDTNANTTKDDLEKVERTVFNNSGISQNLFNADGNLAVSNSIIVDAASIQDIPLQFSSLLNRIIAKFNRNRHYEFRGMVLDTTWFNYQELAKMYKEQASLGYSKMLPQIALGHSQASILSTLLFENEVLHLAEIMIPPMQSSVMSTRILGNVSSSESSKNQNQTQNNNGGRPEKPDNEKSDKTIANRESMS